MNDRTLSNNEAAEYIGVRPQTLALWRSARRYDIPYIRLGNHLIRYRKADLDAWLEKQTVRVETDA